VNGTHGAGQSADGLVCNKVGPSSSISSCWREGVAIMYGCGVTIYSVLSFLSEDLRELLRGIPNR